jgi:hypothetical protein
MRLGRLTVGAFLLTTASCTGPRGPLVGAGLPSPLVGHWMETTFPNRHLILRSDGSFTNSGGSTSEYFRHEGTFEVKGSRIEFHPKRFVSKDGTGSPAIVEEPSRYRSIFDNCRFEFDGSALVLHYTTYPGDAPVPTTMRLERQ